MKNETLIIIVGVAAVAGIGYYIYKKKKANTPTSSQQTASPGSNTGTSTTDLIHSGLDTLTTAWNDISSLFGGSGVGAATAPAS